MLTIILCGGKGTRIRDVTEEIPKPLIEIGSKALVHHIMDHYAKFEEKDFILALGYKADKFFDYCINAFGSVWYPFKAKTFKLTEKVTNEIGYDIKLLDTGLETNTGGRFIKIIQKLWKENETPRNIGLTYGDGVTDLDISKLKAFHDKHDKIGTVSLVRPKNKYGIFTVKEQGLAKTQDDNIPLGLALKFEEKPQMKEWANGGFMIFRLNDNFMLKMLDFHYNVSLEKDIIPTLVEQQEIMCYQHQGYWQNMDTLSEYNKLQADYKEGKF